ncbi:hypothetical protein MKZ38_000689 [Zalerion maritima]|uniref:Uncharacterized protein n=1 Tax=Zalerion maritima TaxID=339359 RepID=A0AAD5WTL2_9PEZI|nr:hypothetical protein MKZ38_000689 [Zalerion maritima]
MAPKESMSNSNRWTAEVDRDLLLAMLAAQNAITPQWKIVNDIMKRLGHSFTDSAVSQRWSKTIFKKFKEEHNIDDVGQLAAVAPPRAGRRPAAAAAASASSPVSGGDGSTGLSGTAALKPAPKRRGRPPKKAAQAAAAAAASSPTVTTDPAGGSDEGPLLKKLKTDDAKGEPDVADIKKEIVEADFDIPAAPAPNPKRTKTTAKSRAGRKPKVATGLTVPPHAGLMGTMQDVIPKVEARSAEMTQPMGQQYNPGQVDNMRMQPMGWQMGQSPQGQAQFGYMGNMMPQFGDNNMDRSPQLLNETDNSYADNFGFPYGSGSQQGQYGGDFGGDFDGDFGGTEGHAFDPNAQHGAFVPQVSTPDENTGVGVFGPDESSLASGGPPPPPTPEQSSKSDGENAFI